MIDRKVFNGGMCSDISPDFIGAGDYVLAQNCRITHDETGNAISAKPVNGTTLLFDSSDGTEELGRLTRDDGIYVFMNNNKLYYSNGTDTYTILTSSQVEGGLTFGGRVNGVAIIGDYLYWTDGVNRPMRINVERGIKTNHSSYVTTELPYVNLKEYDITVNRRQPIFPPVIVKQTVDSRVNNYIKDSSFQFAVRFIYKSFEQSVLSQYSILSPHNAANDVFNTVKVSLSASEVIDDEVQSVEFLVRRGNIGVWHLIKSFNKDENAAEMLGHPGTPLTFYFYGDSIGAAIPTSESGVYFYDVPIKSKALEIAGNRVFLGNNTRGYDYPVSDNIITRFNEGTSIRIGIYYDFGWTSSTGHNLNQGILKILLGDAAGWYTTDIVQGSEIPALLVVDPTRYIGSLADYPTEASIFAWLETAMNYSNPVVVTLGTGSVDAVAAEAVKSGFIFKSNNNYKVGIVYYDEFGMNAGVAHNPVSLATPERKFDEGYFKLFLSWILPGGYRPNIPTWAKYYSVVRTNALNTKFFLAGFSNSVMYGLKNDEGVYVPQGTYGSTLDSVLIDASSLFSYNLGYTYSEGDSIKLITNTSSVFNLSVIGTQGKWIVASLLDIGVLYTGAYYFEIYRANSDTESGVFYEVGSVYKVLNPGTSQRSFSVTLGELRGDTSLVIRSSGGVHIGVCEAMNRNNKFWSFWDTDRGRVNAVLQSKQRTFNEVAWSETYFEGTELNGLNAFLPLNIKYIDPVAGDLRKLVFTSNIQQIGTVMLAICESEVISMYLNRQEFFSSQESSSVLKSAEVIGTMNMLKDGHGTKSPESIVEYNGDVYWLSTNSASFVRYGTNGIIPISDDKMALYAKYITGKIKGGNNILVVGGFDEYNKEYLCSINDAAFPVSYPVLDVEDTISTTKTGESITVTLVAGSLYKMDITFVNPLLFLVTVNDVYHGQKSVVSTGDDISFQFWAGTDGANTMPVSSAAALNGSEFFVVIKKQRIDPYIHSNNLNRTIAFNGRWGTYFSFINDGVSSINNVLIGSNGGKLYKHTNADKNNFYGVKHPSYISFVSNVAANQVKRFMGLSLEGSGSPDYVHIRTEEPYTQSSDLIASDFKQREGVHYANFLNDGLTPGSGSRESKIKHGDSMVGRYAYILVEWVEDFKFKMAGILSRPSSGHKI